MNMVKLLVLIAVALMNSCTTPVQQVKSVSGGRVAVALTNIPSARTVVADFSKAVNNVVVTLTSHDGFAQQSATVALPATTVSFGNVQSGTWDVTAVARNSAGQTVGSATATGQKVTSTSPVAVNLAIQFSQSGTGAYSLTISFPQAVGFDTVQGDLSNSSGKAGSQAVFSATSTPTLASTLSGTNYLPTFSQTNIPSGAYSLKLTFTNSNGLTLVFVEAINIWDNQTSSLWIDPNGVAAPARTFTVADFAADASLAGLALTNNDGTALQLTPAFSSGVTNYDVTGISPTGVSFNATQSTVGQVFSVSSSGDSMVSGSNPYTINSPFDGQIISLTVVAANGSTTNTYSLTLHMVQPNDVPTGLLVTTGTSNNLALTWSGTSPLYKVYRSTDAISWTVVATQSLTAYLDPGLTPGTLYYYEVAGSGGGLLDSTTTGSAMGATLDATGMPVVLTSQVYSPGNPTAPYPTLVSANWVNLFYLDSIPSSSSPNESVVIAGGYKYYAFKDLNNGGSFLIAKYDSAGNYVNAIPISGTRYIYSITTSPPNVLFSGQGGVGINVAWPGGFP